MHPALIVLIVVSVLGLIAGLLYAFREQIGLERKPGSTTTTSASVSPSVAAATQTQTTPSLSTLVAPSLLLSTTTMTKKTTTATSATIGQGGKWFCVQMPRSWSNESLPVKEENGVFFCEANSPRDGCNHHMSEGAAQCNEWLKKNPNPPAFRIPGGIADHRAKTAWLTITGGKCAPYCAQIGNETIQSIYEKY